MFISLIYDVVLVHPGGNCSNNADVIYGLICLHAHICIEAVIETQLLLCVTSNLPRAKSTVRTVSDCGIVTGFYTLHDSRYCV